MRRGERIPSAVSLICVLIGSMVGAGPAQSVPDLDPSFGSGGFARVGLLPGASDTPWDLLVQQDGKILTAGISDEGGSGWFLALTRHFADGSLDTLGFGTQGKVALHFAYRDQANALAQQANGQILVVGQQAVSNNGSDQVPSIYRFNCDGSIDSTFSEDGMWADRFEPVSSGQLSGVRALPGGKILVAGLINGNASGGHNGFAFRRLLSDGSPDPSYASGGTRLFYVPTLWFTPPAVCFLPDGGVLAAAHVVEGGQVRFVAVRVDSAGSLIPFPSGDILRTQIIAYSYQRVSVAALENGKFLIAGTIPETGNPVDGSFGVFQFLADGTPDSTFGTNGVTEVQLSTSTNYLHDIAIQPNGNILLAGYLGGIYGGLVRLTPNGSLDPTFGQNGIAEIDVSQGNGTGYFTRIRLLGGVHILAAGYDFTSGQGDFVLTKFAISTSAVLDAPTELKVPHVVCLAFPNPFRSRTLLSFDLPEPSRVEIDIFDVNGRKVDRVAEGVLTAGRHEVPWSVETVGNGVYFARLTIRELNGRIGTQGSARLLRLQ